MTIDGLKAYATDFYNKDWIFSNLIAWRKIVGLNPSTYNLLQYADALRIVGLRNESEHIFKQIDIHEIPEEFKFAFYIKIGLLYEDIGEYDKSIKAFKLSIAMGTNQTYPYIFLGNLLSKQNEFEEAERILLAALDKEGDIDEVLFNLSTIYARKSDYVKAIETMQKCLDLKTEYPNAERFLLDYKNVLKISKNEFL